MQTTPKTPELSLVPILSGTDPSALQKGSQCLLFLQAPQSGRTHSSTALPAENKTPLALISLPPAAEHCRFLVVSLRTTFPDHKRHGKSSCGKCKPRPSNSSTTVPSHPKPRFPVLPSCRGSCSQNPAGQPPGCSPHGPGPSGLPIQVFWGALGMRRGWHKPSQELQIFQMIFTSLMTSIYPSEHKIICQCQHAIPSPPLC